MQHTGRAGHHTVVVVGAGQAGLAMSWHLTARGIDHVVLERGEVAQAWRSERWDSLRLLTPAWLCELPGAPYDGDDPEAFLTAAATGDLLAAYAGAIGAPVLTGQTVVEARRTAAGWEVATATDRFTSDALVVATGAASDTAVPAWAAALPPDIETVSALRYRNPAGVPDGEVLVVGASASGAQIADELARAGRPVTLAVGEHVRVPRTYRGIDIHRWLHTVGHLEERWDEVDDIVRARRLPSFQLIGTPERRDLDLTTLAGLGVQLVGRAMALDGHRLLCSGGLAREVAAADLKAGRLLRRFDEHAIAAGLDVELPPPTELEPTPMPAHAVTEVDVRRFSAVVWATGYRPRFAWLDPAAFDRKGRLAHDGGVGVIDGLYVLGLPFLRRRRSSFISGVGSDAADLAAHLHTRLGNQVGDRRRGPVRDRRLVGPGAPGGCG